MQVQPTSIETPAASLLVQSIRVRRRRERARESAARSISLVDAMHDPALFGPWFEDRESWLSWETFLRALTGLPIEGDALATYRRHTQREAPGLEAASEAWVIVGRRGGKSRIAALIAVFLACFKNYEQYLAPGEVGTMAVLAADRLQARTVMRYIRGFIDSVPLLKSMVVEPNTKETITFSNRVAIETHTASFRSTRGYTLIGVICDEIAFWQTDDGAANPDVEILASLRPAMATIPGATLIAISSPYARRGALWDMYRDHFGKDDDPRLLVWQGDTASMNPRVDPAIIEKAYADDDAAADAEYGANFRRDIERLIPREVVDAVTPVDRKVLPPKDGVRYMAFVDPSGGSQDSMTLAIAHVDGATRILDCVLEVKPPFEPSVVVATFCETVRAYRCTEVVGDHYGGEWPREHFRARGVSYRTCEYTRSQLYLELLPLLNSKTVELLDLPVLKTQLCNLERRTSRVGKDTVDHPPGSHDDVANAAAGALVGTRSNTGSVRTLLF